MNIGRAKITLIIAFLGLNIFLLYSLLQPALTGVQTTDLPLKERQRIEAVLDQGNYILDVSLNRAVPSSTFITVTPFLVDRAAVTKEAYSFTTNDEQIAIYLCPNKQVKFYPEGRVEIHYVPGIMLSSDGSSFNEEEVPLQVEAYLQGNFPFRQLIFDRIQEGRSGERIINYVQGVGGFNLYSSYIKATVIGERLTAVDCYWLRTLERPPESPMDIISAAEAVVKLIETLGPADQISHIIDVELGYYSQKYEAEQWDVPPVWRIMIDGEIYYINAFTGHLENILNTNEEEGPSNF